MYLLAWIKTKSKCHTIISSGLSLYGVSCMKWAGEVCYRTKRHYRYPTATVVSVYDSHPIFDYLGINKHTSAISSTLSNNSCSQKYQDLENVGRTLPNFWSIDCWWKNSKLTESSAEVSLARQSVSYDNTWRYCSYCAQHHRHHHHHHYSMKKL